MFTERETELLNDSINMSLASNKRMQNSKPQFNQIFRTIETELNNLKTKINQTPVVSNKSK